MKTLNVYVTSNFISTAAVAIVVLTFGMMGVNLIKVFEFVSRGVPVSSAMSFLLYLMPMSFSLTIPVSVLVSIMLVFGRMSADNEITAIRACGISILQIISPIIILTFLLTCVCLALQLDIGPKCTAHAKQLLKEVGVKQPMAILEPGRPVEYENFNIYIDDRIGENQLKDIQVFVLNRNHTRVQQDITAATGRIEVDEQKEEMKIILDNATVAAYENEGERPRRTCSKEMRFIIDYGKKFNEIKLMEKTGFLGLNDLFGKTVFYRRNNQDTTPMEVELNKRIALGLAPVAFLLLGMPLAIRTSRRETSINLFLSVLLAGIYFVSIMIFQAIDTKPQLHPQWLLWIPSIIYQFGGIYYIYKVART